MTICLVAVGRFGWRLEKGEKIYDLRTIEPSFCRICIALMVKKKKTRKKKREKYLSLFLFCCCSGHESVSREDYFKF